MLKDTAPTEIGSPERRRRQPRRLPFLRHSHGRPWNEAISAGPGRVAPGQIRVRPAFSCRAALLAQVAHATFRPGPERGQIWRDTPGL